MSRESPTLDELYGVGAEHADDGIEMKSYHLTQEQVLEIVSNLELDGRDITVWTDGYVEFETKTALQLFANAALDQVFGEPVGYVNEKSLEMLKDSQQAKACATLWRTGIWDSANVALYAPKEKS